MYIVKTLDNKKNNAIDALVRLTNGVDGKSDAAKLRGVIESVELALSSGVCRKKVLESIRESLDINMSLKTFEKNLYRIRKKRKSEKLEAETSQKSYTGLKQLIADSDNTRVLGNKVSPEYSARDGGNHKKFLSPKDLRDIRLNTLREQDNESNVLSDIE